MKRLHETMRLPYTPEELSEANKSWGCNCGPAALAVALQLTLAQIRFGFPEFPGTPYTNGVHMKRALDVFGARHTALTPASAAEISFAVNLCPVLWRVQFSGPWNAKGAPKGWAYKHTHWVCAWAERGVSLIADVNEPRILDLWEWEQETVPRIAKSIDQADGAWQIRDAWRLYK